MPCRSLVCTKPTAVSLPNNHLKSWLAPAEHSDQQKNEGSTAQALAYRPISAIWPLDFNNVLVTQSLIFHVYLDTILSALFTYLDVHRVLPAIFNLQTPTPPVFSSPSLKMKDLMFLDWNFGSMQKTKQTNKQERHKDQISCTSNFYHFYHTCTVQLHQ